MTERTDEIEAINRIGTSRDGYLLRRYLQRVINGVSPASAPIGALRDFEGRRRFALELRGHLDEAVPSAGTTSGPGKPDPDEPFAVARAESVALERGGSRRRVEPYPEPGNKA